MATLNLPSWFDVYECEATLVPEVRGFAGPFGGPTEVQDLLGDRWRFRLTLPDGDFSHGGRTEALFNRLRGGADWLRLYHFAKPVPLGTARGSIVLASAVAQGANTLSLAGCKSGENLFLNSGFEIDSDANGVGDGWFPYFNSVTGQAYSRTDGNGSLWAQVCFASSLGPSSASQVGVARGLEPVTAGLAYSLSCDAVANYTTLNVWLYVAWYTAGGAFISDSSSQTPGPAVFQRLSLTATAPPTATQAIAYIWAAGAGTTLSNAQIYLDNVQWQQGPPTPYSGLATLQAGDMLGYNGEQLFQVYEDATANDAGAMTVTTVNRARKAIASGQSIAWAFPSVPFQLLDTAGVPTAYTRGRARGQQVEFIEAWQA